MKKWNAVILAGDRGLNDPVAKAAKVTSKAAVKFQNKTLIEHVVSVLHGAESINRIFTLGPSQQCLNERRDVKHMLECLNVTYLEPQTGPSASALRGVIASNYYPTLVVTCDLPLLQSAMIDAYCERLNKVAADFVVGAIDYSLIAKTMPDLKKTQYKFQDQCVCFANLFAVQTEKGVRAIEYWREVENSRKNPLEIVRKVDWLSVFKYKLGKLSLDQVAFKLSKKVDAVLEIEKILTPELALDVDSAHDYEVITKYMS